MTEATITITINGDEREVTGQPSVLELLKGLEIDPRAVVVELNRQIVRRTELAGTALHDGDRVELVHFVGGG